MAKKQKLIGISLALSKEQLEKIEKYANEEMRNRSNFIINATMKYIAEKFESEKPVPQEVIER